MNSKKWYKTKVTQGNKLGRVIGFPTINLTIPTSLAKEKKGVYAAFVKIGAQTYQGALYFGPRKVLNEKTNVLEIFVFEFEEEIYDQSISFNLQSFMRGVMDFTDFQTLKTQLEKDCSDVKLFFRNASH